MKNLMPAFTALAFATIAVAAPTSSPTGKGISHFGFSLFRSLHDQNLKEPLAISPLSIAEAMGMVTMGSEKNTLTELEGLFPGVTNRELVVGLAAIRADLTKYAADSKGAFEFTSANALWGNSASDRGFKYKPTFLSSAGTHFGAELKEEPFGDAAVKNINTWVSKHTNGKISKLINSLGKDDVAVLLNAIYTKGKFHSHFSDLASGEYTDAKGKKSQATLLSHHGRMPIYSDKNLKAVTLAIGDSSSRTPSNKVALDILVPTDGKLDNLIKNLDDKKYAEVVSKMSHESVDLTIAAGKVEQENAVSLVAPLSAPPFRLSDSFSDSKAEFGLLGTTVQKYRLYISDILTKTFYEVTPFGFEAAAATAVVVAEASAAPAKPVALSITGPSVHVIRHVASGAPLFIMAYDSPVEYDEARILELTEVGAKAGTIIRTKTAAGTITSQRDFGTGKTTIVLLDEDYKVIKVYKTL